MPQQQGSGEFVRIHIGSVSGTPFGGRRGVFPAGTQRICLTRNGIAAETLRRIFRRCHRLRDTSFG